MVPMMTLLDHMSHNKITPSVEMGEEGRPALPDMPPWMSLLHKKMSEGTTERNVRLFIARLIVNRPKVCIHASIYRKLIIYIISGLF